MPKKVAIKVNEEIKRRGLEGGYSCSLTDYGESAYFTRYNDDYDKLKIRISDHSVENRSRMAEEVLIDVRKVNDKVIQKLADMIEAHLYPERFHFVDVSKGVDGLWYSKNGVGMNGYEGFYSMDGNQLKRLERK